jgi:hypothetical protein
LTWFDDTDGRLIKLGLNQSNSLAKALDARAVYRRDFVIRRDHATCRTEETSANDDNPPKLRQAPLIAGQKPARVQLSQRQ